MAAAFSVPATIVKWVPSTSSSMAAAVARFAASNLSIGACIEVEQSMMMASTRSVGAVRPEGWAATSSPAVMLTIASTVPVPSARYGLWSTSTEMPCCSAELMRFSDRDYCNGDVVLAAGVQGVFDESARSRGRVETGAELCDVGGVGQVVPQAVATHQQPTPAGWRDRVHARFRPRLRVAIGAEPTRQCVCAALHGFRVGRGACGDQLLRQGVVDCQLLRGFGRFGKPVRPAVADVANRNLHCPCRSRDDYRSGIRARRRG